MKSELKTIMASSVVDAKSIVDLLSVFPVITMHTSSNTDSSIVEHQSLNLYV